MPSTSYEPAEVRRHLIHSPWFLDLPSFTPYRRFQRRTRAFAGGTLTSQSTDVFSFPSPSPPGFLPRQLRRRRRHGDVLLQGAYPHPRTYPSLRSIRADVPASPRSRSPEPHETRKTRHFAFSEGALTRACCSPSSPTRSSPRRDRSVPSPRAPSTRSSTILARERTRYVHSMPRSP